MHRLQVFDRHVGGMRHAHTLDLLNRHADDGRTIEPPIIFREPRR